MLALLLLLRNGGMGGTGDKNKNTKEEKVFFG